MKKNNNNGILIPNKEYREREGVSSTDLKKIAKSPAHFRYWKDHPQEDTPSLLFGRAAHKYMLEKDDFFEEFEVAKDFKYGTKADKEETQQFICKKAIECGKGEEWDNFIITNPRKEDVVLFYRSLIVGKDIISVDDMQKIEDMYEALYSTPFVKTLLSGKKELSFFCEDEETGEIMKVRPDCLTELGDANVYVEYKTCDDADSDRFMKQAIDLKYDMQASFYKHVLEKVTGKKFDVIFIAQEKKPPYCVNILEANTYFIASGNDMWRTWLNVYSECKKTNNWYGYIQGEINTLGLPNWLQKQYE